MSEPRPHLETLKEIEGGLVPTLVEILLTGVRSRGRAVGSMGYDRLAP